MASYSLDGPSAWRDRIPTVLIRDILLGKIMEKFKRNEKGAGRARL
jgi:hypothetical protein